MEQRKRLTIAVELVANPSIIFMDEPTSGLDARAAAIVMRAVRNIVNTGRTIVCTIHQPSIDIFESFDELLLLKVPRLSPLPCTRSVLLLPNSDFVYITSITHHDLNQEQSGTIPGCAQAQTGYLIAALC